MSEAVRDVVVRVSVEGGRIDKMPDFERLTATATSFYNVVNEGNRQLRGDLAEVSTATAKFTEQLRAATDINLKNLGFDDISAALDDVATAQQDVLDGMNEMSGRDVGDLGLDDAAAAAKKAADNLEEAAAAATALDGVDVGNIMGGDGAAEVSAAIEQLNQDIAASVEGLEAAWAAADELAATGQQIEDELAASLEAATQQAMDLAQAELDAKEAATAATKDMGTATAQAGKSSADSIFKQIALTERLAAYQRKAADEVVKEEKKKQDAIKKAGEEQQKQLFAATGALAQALAAGTQFVATLKLIGGESPEIEELARQFAKVQGIVQGISAGTQAFNSINQGLAGLQTAAAAATTQLGITGATATGTQAALIRLAPAAAMAQAALGPVAVAVAGISLAVMGVSAVADYFKTDLPNDADRSARAFEKVTAQIDQMRRKIDATTRSMEHQNSLLRLEMELRKTLEGEVTAGNVQENMQLATQSAENQAAAGTATAQNEAARQKAELEKKRNDLINEQEKLEQADTEQKSWWGGDGKNEDRERRKREISGELSGLSGQIIDSQIASEGVGVDLTLASMSEYADAIRNLPEEQQTAYSAVLTQFATSMESSLRSANADLESALNSSQNAIDDNTRQQQEEREKFEREQNIAVRLQSDPNERKALEQEVNNAAATGNLNAGVDAVSGIVSSERERELRNQLAEGNLTREKLLEEIADAAEFETEKKQLEETVEELKLQAKALESTRLAVKEQQENVRKQMEQLRDELQQTQQAQQAR